MDPVFGNFGNKTADSFIFQIRKINYLLMTLAQKTTNLFVSDVSAMYSSRGTSYCFDPRLYINADVIWSLEFTTDLAVNTVQILESFTGFSKKCLILDLDNTVWGGIIGDDGIDNMILRLDDISIFVANWDNKADNIRYIQSVLNIGFDSMVFLDDNPFEREMVKTHVPQLTVPDLPEDPSEYIPYINTLNLFETVSYTAEDKDRTKQYQEEANRTIARAKYTDEKDFLISLHMVSEVKHFDGFSTPRVAQLTQRSNQFNLRTIRYTEVDIKRIAASDDFVTFTFNLEDKFGDHGLISAVILEKKHNEELFVDTWIMSCRVLKRGVEQFVLAELIQWAKANGFEKLTGQYIPTPKNALVKDHFKDLGFITTEQKEGYWSLLIHDYQKKPFYISSKI